MRTNGIELAVFEHGPKDAPAVLLLHGFPECAHGWSRQVPALVEAGYRCVVPDLRGYGASDKPREVSAYAVRTLVADVLGLMDALGRRRFHVVAHDWGGVLGWHLASDHADRVASASILNIPHPAVMARHLATSPRQLSMSWYMFVFQLPWVPERMLTVERLTRVLFASAGERPLTEDDLAVYRAAWTAPGAVRGMVNWYRAATRYSTVPSTPRVTRPTQIVFGQRDIALDWRMAEWSASRCDDVVLRLLPDVGHFVQHGASAQVNAFLLEFLARHRDEPGCGPADGLS